jgi:hypothetical protein
MNVITDTWRGLVRRKLWPGALLLVAALVAVPLLLAKEPAPPATAASTAHAAKTEGLPATFVSAAEEPEEGSRRRVLGLAKDPFEPAALPKVKKKKQQTEKPDADTAKAEKTTETGGKAADPAPPSAPPVAPAPTPTPTYPLYSINVGFGLSDSDIPTGEMERLTPLPSVEDPIIVYLGVEDGGKVAVFMITGSVTAQGDGECDPSPEDCQTLRLRVGETEFLDIKGTGEATDAQYQLDLNKIHTKKTTDAEKAKASRAKAAKAGNELVRKEARRQPLRYSFDDESGTLHRLDKKSYKRLLAQLK